MMKPRPVVGIHVCALELQSIFKMAAKSTLKLSIYQPINIIMNSKHSINNQKHSGCTIALFYYTLGQYYLI